MINKSIKEGGQTKLHTIKDLRKQNGWTQSELGKKFKVAKAPEIICRWEKGVASPTGSHLQELSHIFGVPAEKILIS